MAQKPASPWNSLERTKILVSLLTPIVVALVGYFIQQQIAEQQQFWQAQQKIAERIWQTQQRIVERRLQVYDAIRIELNRIYCFVQDVGTYKEDNPETVIGFKRRIDETMHSQRALWGPDTFQAYLEYMNAAFATYAGGVGRDAKIRTSDREKKVGIPGWKEEWSQERLTGTRDEKHHEKFDTLINLISRDLSFASAIR